MRTRARYQHLDRIPEGFSRKIPLKDVTPGDELLWSDDAAVAVITRIELVGHAGDKDRRYRIETKPKNDPQGPITVEEFGPTAKLFVRKITP
ncbi:MAG: hypothetical protein ACRD19_14110 [Terriglobia bacterium]